MLYGEEKGIEKDVFLEMLKEQLQKLIKKLYDSRSKCTCRN